MEKVFLTEQIHADAVAFLKERFEVVQGTSVDAAEMIRQAQGCAAILIRSARITAEIMDKIPSLKVIAKPRESYSFRKSVSAMSGNPVSSETSAGSANSVINVSGLCISVSLESTGLIQ